MDIKINTDQSKIKIITHAIKEIKDNNNSDTDDKTCFTLNGSAILGGLNYII